MRRVTYDVCKICVVNTCDIHNNNAVLMSILGSDTYSVPTIFNKFN